jgi:hypothetical protein
VKRDGHWRLQKRTVDQTAVSERFERDPKKREWFALTAAARRARADHEPNWAARAEPEHLGAGERAPACDGARECSG